MRGILKYLITLPLFALPAIAGGNSDVLAAEVGPVAALELLAESKSADQKCKFLSVGERDELSTYLARAEVAAAERMSLSTAQSALATGKARGTASACGEAAENSTRVTLKAAREAMAAVDGGRLRGRVGEAEEQPRALAEPAPKLMNKRVALLDPPKRMFRREARALPVNGAIGRYAAEAAAYYADRKCRMLSHDNAKSFWNGIVIRHRAAIAAHGRKTVARMLKQAEGAAAAANCGTRTALAIKHGFDSATR